MNWHPCNLNLVSQLEPELIPHGTLLPGLKDERCARAGRSAWREKAALEIFPIKQIVNISKEAEGARLVKR